MIMRNGRKNSVAMAAFRLLVATAIACAISGRTIAQTPGGTVISNSASASYSDATNTYQTVTNTLTVTASNVSGRSTTPDAGCNPTVVAGQTLVLFSFT